MKLARGKIPSDLKYDFIEEILQKHNFNNAFTFAHRLVSLITYERQLFFIISSIMLLLSHCYQEFIKTTELNFFLSSIRCSKLNVINYRHDPLYLYFVREEGNHFTWQ